MSTLKTDTISEKTTNNGVAIDTFKLKDSVMISSNTVASGTISSTENAMVIGPIGVTGTVNVSGNLSVL
tara:strand:+ start:506 stop:712 length:207 start_codon:yes stop_codon:yes gene_type:complete